MATILKETETYTNEDAEGNLTTTTVEKTRKVERSTEPDYVKIYTNMWCEFNQIPHVWRELFMQLVMRMSYCRMTGEQNNSGGQLVNVGKPWGDDICRALGWKVTPNKSSNQLMSGLRELCKCNAIKKINRGVYQINPQYAGKGEWKYNPKAERGGVENLIASFNFKDGTVQTKADWVEDHEDNAFNEEMRQGLGVKPEDNAAMYSIRYTPNKKKNTEEAEHGEGQRETSADPLCLV